MRSGDRSAVFDPSSSIIRSGTPQLLVSVRNAAEARAALAGGCGIVDVKEPSRGALGMASVESIKQVLAVANAFDKERQVPVTAALGETRNWLGGRPVPSIPAGVSFVKLGLAELGEPGWQRRWSDAREKLDQAADQRLRWIAVAYADWKAADAPPPEAIIATAIESRCAGVLFDTYRKDGRDLLEHIAPHRLREGIERIQAAGLCAALAGSLTLRAMPVLLELQPDVVAVRGAACAGGKRSAEVSAQAVAALRSAMTGPGGRK